MSSDEDQVPVKKRRVQRACDMCRMKKRACDGLRMSTKKCTNCIEIGLDCTFAGAVTKRRSYVNVLEARLELTEQLLRKLSPQSEVGANNPSPESSRWSSDSPVLTHTGAAVGPGVELATLAIRSMNNPAPAPHGDDLAHIALVQDIQELSINQHRERYHGSSSSALLVKAAVQMRERYEEKGMPWSSRRMHYWTFDPAKDQRPHTGPYVFPEADLLSALIDLYFIHSNLYYPLLHRPTFERSIAGGLHVRDASFGAVVLLVCAIGSRFSSDPRVCGPEDEPLRCGWKYFDQLTHIIHVFSRPTVYHLQYYCLAVYFLQHSTPTPCWTLIGIGIRLAQDVGAHRANKLGTAPTVESELWKRAFWVLVCYDRQSSTGLGRTCTTHYEDFDVELPIECDDEFWETEDPAQAFKQPADKPSKIAFFNCFIRLSNILAFSLKMLYSLNKAKGLLAVRDEAWEERIVAELDTALNDWVDAIPSHLRWDPNRRNDDFFDQSAYLYASYYQVQMTIHRPFISMVRKDASAALPSLAICTNAARSCSHVCDISKHRKDTAPIPVLVNAAFTSGLVLLLNVWNGKRTGLAPQMNSAIAEVHKCIECVRMCDQRWQSAGLFGDLMYELAAMSQLPLATRPPPAPTAGTSKNKRAREADAGQRYPSGATTIARYPPCADSYPASAPPPTFNVPEFTLPTYTADLGSLPVFHPYTESNPTQNFENPDGSYGSAFFPSGGYPAEFGPEAEMDMLAMWANAPMGFEVDDWGTYFTVMNEALGTAGAQT